jgi:hypothetical protein
MNSRTSSSVFDGCQTRPPSDRRRLAGRARSRTLLGALALLCAAATAGCGGVSAPAAPAAQNAASAQATSHAPTPTPTVSSSVSASAAPGGAETGRGAPTSAATSPPGESQAASPAAVRIDVAPAHLPGYTAESWTASSAGPVRDVSGHDIELNECASIHGASTWQQQPYVSSGGNSAILEAYTFSTSAQADSAFTAVLSGMQVCQATSRALQTTNHITADAVTRETASATDAAAFERTWTGVEGISAGGLQTNHLYLAVNGSDVVVLHFDELAATSASASPYDVRSDPAVLSLLKSVAANQD